MSGPFFPKKKSINHRNKIERNNKQTTKSSKIFHQLREFGKKDLDRERERWEYLKTTSATEIDFIHSFRLGFEKISQSKNNAMAKKNWGLKQLPDSLSNGIRITMCDFDERKTTEIRVWDECQWEFQWL